MKPILFPSNATTYTTNGIGRLEPTSCTVIEERNGQYELSCVVPVESPHYSDIRNNMIIAVSPSDGATLQAFRIYQITEPLNGLVAISARHISYDLSYNTVMPFTAGSCSAALSGLSTYAVETQPFTFWTDKSVVSNFTVKTPQPIRSCLGGQRGSVLDVYGGVYEWDNWTVKLWTRRGSDNGVTLRYGKNITDLTQEQNLESVVTGIVPFWANEETVVTLPEKSVDSTYASQYPYKRTVPVDFSSEWESAPTAAQLRSRAQTYVVNNNIGVPKVSIKVSFVALWQTEEYKTVAPLERVKLCDTVHIVFERYNIDAVSEVVRTEWDVLNERYLSIELGEARANLANTIVQMNDQTNQAIADTTSELQGAIDRATSIITGQNGGWLKINSNSDGQPYELLIMDEPEITDAVKLWRWNLAGLGYSNNGYDGPFGLAMTMNGEIVANFITTGEMSANRIRTGLLESTAKQTGTNIPVSQWDLDTGKLTTKDIDITGGSITLDADNFWNLATKTFNVSTVGASYTYGIYADPTHFSLFAQPNGGNATNYWHLHTGAFRVGGPSATDPHIKLDNFNDDAAFEIYSDSDNYWNLKTGNFKTTHGIFTGSISATAISGGTISGTTIAGSTVTVGTNVGSKISVDSTTGRITSYYNGNETGFLKGGTDVNSSACIALNVPNSNYVVSCAASETVIGNCNVFESPNGILCGTSGVEIYVTNGIKINSTACDSGTFSAGGHTLTINNGLITSIT